MERESAQGGGARQRARTSRENLTEGAVAYLCVAVDWMEHGTGNTEQGESQKAEDSCIFPILPCSRGEVGSLMLRSTSE